MRKKWDRYKYVIETESGDLLYKADPYAFHAEVRPGNASKVADIDGYTWHDAKWLEKLVSKQKDRLETLDRLIAKLYDDLINDKITESVFDKMLEKTQKEQTDIKKELFQNESVLNTEEKLDAQSQQWIDDISEYADIKELDANLLNRLISKIVISEPQEKDGTENYCRTPETVTMEIHFNLKPIPELGTIERGSGSHK